MSVWLCNLYTNAYFGVDARKITGEKLKEFGVKKTMLLYDEAMKPLGFLDEMVGIIEAAGLEVVPYQVEVGEPTSGKVDRAGAFAREKEIDSIVGMGGGSCMDTAKLVGKLLANGGKTEDFLGYVGAIEGKDFSPVFAIPTTSGTGSETTGGAVCEIESEKRKAVGKQRATLAIVDPVYTYDLPPAITAFTGLDALAHSAESLCNSDAMTNLMSDVLGKEVVKLVFKWLPIACKEGKNNPEARLWMSFASMMSGYAVWGRRTTFGHALANQLSDHYHIPHGLGVAAGLAAVVRYNVTGDPASTRRLAECCGIDCPEGADMVEVGRKVVAKFDELQKTCGTKNLKELGIPREFIDVASDNISKDTKWKIIPNPPNFELMRKCIHESYDY